MFRRNDIVDGPLWACYEHNHLENMETQVLTSSEMLALKDYNLLVRPTNTSSTVSSFK